MYRKYLLTVCNHFVSRKIENQKTKINCSHSNAMQNENFQTQTIEKMIISWEKMFFFVVLPFALNVKVLDFFFFRFTCEFYERVE